VINIPVPPSDLIFLVSGHRSPDLYLTIGKAAFDRVRQTFHLAGRSLDSFTDVLEWGCGCARITRHWFDDNLAAGKRICGCDINPKLIQWCQENVIQGEFQTCGLLPPTGYADASFDVVYAGSVLTHLGIQAQFAWMRELWRVLRPGGLAVITFHGSFYLTKFRTRDSFDLRFLDEHLIGVVGEEEGSNSFGSIHTPGAIMSLFEPFAIVRHLPRHGVCGEQDTAILEKQSKIDVLEVPRLSLAVPRGGINAETAVELTLSGQRCLLTFVRNASGRAGFELQLDLRSVEGESLAAGRHDFLSPRSMCYESVRLGWTSSEKPSNAALIASVTLHQQTDADQLIELDFTSAF
jgi:SAM-dependent methyltransferase